MKKLHWVIAVLLLVALPAWAGVGHAQRFSNNIEEGEVVRSSLYSASKEVTIKGTVDGDVFCAGQTVRVEAVVHGDVICAGRDVTVNGKVDGDIRLAGQTVNVGAEVDQSATVAAMNFSLDAEASVGRDLTATGETLNIKGEVGRDISASGSKLIINGPVGRNIAAQSEHVQLKENAAIAGNLTYTSNNQVRLDNGAEVRGDTTKSAPQRKKSSPFNMIWFLFVLFGLLLISVALALFFPQLLKRTSDTVKDNFGKSLLVGIISALLLPALCFALSLTVVGIPLALFIVLVAILAASLSGPVVAYFVGRLVLRKTKSPAFLAAAGSVIVAVAYFIPLLGFFIIFLVFFLGFGAIVIELQRHMKQAKPKAKTA